MAVHFAARLRMPHTSRPDGLARVAWAMAVLLGVLALVTAALVWRDQQAEASVVQASVDRLVGASSSPRSVPSTLAAEPSDFTATLPKPSAHDFAQHITRAAADAGVQISALQFAAAVASHEQSMSRLDVSLELRGPYSAVHRVLKELQDRHAGLTLKSLRMRAGAAPAEAHATLGLSLWSVPEARR